MFENEENDWNFLVKFYRIWWCTLNPCETLVVFPKHFKELALLILICALKKFKKIVVCMECIRKPICFRN